MTLSRERSLQYHETLSQKLTEHSSIVKSVLVLFEIENIYVI